jgi:hypothetical protein
LDEFQGVTSDDLIGVAADEPEEAIEAEDHD